jgi:hypothetical protein
MSTLRDWELLEDKIPARSLAAGDPTGWFDELYAAGAAGVVSMPRDRRTAHPLLVEWAETRKLSGVRRRAVVVGCGLGAGAESLASLGYQKQRRQINVNVREFAGRSTRLRHRHGRAPGFQYVGRPLCAGRLLFAVCTKGVEARRRDPHVGAHHNNFDRPKDCAVGERRVTEARLFRRFAKGGAASGAAYA